MQVMVMVVHQDPDAGIKYIPDKYLITDHVLSAREGYVCTGVCHCVKGWDMGQQCVEGRGRSIIQEVNSPEGSTLWR